MTTKVHVPITLHKSNDLLLKSNLVNQFNLHSGNYQKWLKNWSGELVQKPDNFQVLQLVFLVDHKPPFSMDFSAKYFANFSFVVVQKGHQSREQLLKKLGLGVMM